MYLPDNHTPEEHRMKMIVALAIGAIVFLMGFMSDLKIKRMERSCSASTVGIVSGVDYRRVSSGNGNTKQQYQASLTIEDSAAFGSETAVTEWSDREYSSGKSVTVRYDPSDTSVFYVEGYLPHKGKSLKITGGILLAIGGAFALIYLVTNH